MSPYMAILGARIRILLQYRAAALAGLVTQGFWGIIRVMIFTGFYLSRRDDVTVPMTLTQTITYIWLGQALLGLLPIRLDGEVAGMVRNGTVAYELTRPWDLYWAWWTRAVAMRVAPTLLRSVPMVIIAAWLLPSSMAMQPPVSLPAAVLFVASILLAVALGSAITALLTISMLWTISGEGLALAVSGLTWVLSGIIIPLPLLPDGLARVLEWLPFAGVMDLPFRIYVGQIETSQAATVLARQLTWVIVLMSLGRGVLSRGLGRLVVQGG